VRCVGIALNNPPTESESKRVRIFNQMTETHRLIDLANKISELTGAKINFLENPRNEANENELVVANDCFLNLGLDPIKLKDGLLTEIVEVADRYRDRVDESKIPPSSFWLPTLKEKAFVRKR